jgi:hypothetical protein
MTQFHFNLSYISRGGKAQQAGKYQQIVERMNDFLTRPSDRKLFGLEALGSSQTPSSANQDVRP